MEVIVGAKVVLARDVMPRAQYVENAAKALLMSSVAVDEQRNPTWPTIFAEIAAELLFLTQAQLAC